MKNPIVWNIEQAERLARFAHLGQYDKSGEDYFKAHITLAIQMLKYGPETAKSLDGPTLYSQLGSDEDRAMAEMILWLHDTDEDTRLSCKMLMDLGAPYQLWHGVYALTRPSQRPEWAMMTKSTRERANIAYHEVIRDNPILLAAKDADINSNTHPVRVNALRMVDPDAAERLAAKYAHDREALGLEDPWT